MRVNHYGQFYARNNDTIKNTAFNIYCVEYSLHPSFSFLSSFLDLTISGLVSYVTGKLRVTIFRGYQILERSGKFSQSYDHSCSKSMSG